MLTGSEEEDEDSEFPEDDDDLQDHHEDVAEPYPALTLEEMEARRQQEAAAASQAAEAFEKVRSDCSRHQCGISIAWASQEAANLPLLGWQK